MKLITFKRHFFFSFVTHHIPKVKLLTSEQNIPNSQDAKEQFIPGFNLPSACDLIPDRQLRNITLYTCLYYVFQDDQLCPDFTAAYVISTKRSTSPATTYICGQMHPRPHWHTSGLTDQIMTYLVDRSLLYTELFPLLIRLQMNTRSK